MKTTLAVLFLAALGGVASAATLRVPADYATIQAAVDAAKAGDRIRVSSGHWCGATVDKPLRIEGHGFATIIGCSAPVLDPLPLRVGFLLASGASGTQVSGFVFDGTGVSNSNIDPLAFAVFSRGVDDVVIARNLVLGTAQAFTNTGGNGWQVDANAIFDLTAFTCDGYCGGGSAIVFQQRDLEADRAVGNSAERNVITGHIPAGLTEFGLAGVVIYGQDGATASHNFVAIPAHSDGTGDAVGVLVSDQCCGEMAPFKTSINSVIVGNDGRFSPVAVRVTLDSKGGTGNTDGAFIAGNRGKLEINGKTTYGFKAMTAGKRGQLFQ